MKDPITLGQFIKMLEKCQPNEQVFYDFGYLYPTYLMSWRGIFVELSLGYDFRQTSDAPTVSQLLTQCRNALGKTFEGFKGGSYVMDATTPLHIANYGEGGETFIVGLDEDATIITSNERREIYER